MAFVWTRLQRVNKRAAKFQYTASYHRIDLETTSKWKPNKLSLVWSRRSRRVVADPLDWEPSMKEPLKGNVIWAVPDNHTIAVTLFRDQRTNELEDKDWIFILEDVSSTGRRRRIAQAAVNLRPLASIGPSQKCLSLQLRPTTAKIVSASLEVTISSVLLREGSAADEDMQSMASMMSVNNNSDIGHLEDFEEDDCSLSENSASMKQMLDLTQQMDMMTSSLANTPGSCASLASTPIAPIPYDLPTTEDHQSNYEQHLARKSQCLDKFTDYGVTLSDPQRPPLGPSASYKDYVSKRDNLKPLELKTNLNDYKYSGDNASESVTPIVDVSNRDPQTMLTVRRSLSGDDGKEVTPAQDLLEWCREVTKDYKDCDVTDLSTSWKDGVAFCAIIHHFKPDLIEMSSVTRSDPEENIKRALRASSQLGVPGILHSSEFRSSRGPDRLALLTYLHQLRALFTHSQLRLDKIGQTAEESSYTIGRFNTDKDTDISVELFSQEILSMRQKRMEAQPATNRTSLSSQESVDSQHSQDRSSITLSSKPGHNSPDKTSLSGLESNLQKDKSPIGGMRDVKGMILASKNILGKVLSPTKEKISNMRSPFDRFREQSVESKNQPKATEVESKNIKKDPNTKISDTAPVMVTPTVREAWPVKLMTRKQLTDPFASDEEDDDVQDVLTVRVDDSKSKQPTLEMKEEKIAEIKTEEMSHPLAPINKERDTSMSPLSPIECLPKPTQQLLSRHDELKERARQLLEAARREAREKDAGISDSSATSEVTTNSNNSVKDHNGGSVVSPHKSAEDARQAQLRERARKLIADARAGLVTSPTSPGSRGGTVEILTAAQALAEQQMAIGMTNSTRGGSLDNSPARSIHSESNTNSDSENNILKRGESPENNGNITPLRRSFEGGIIKSSSPLQSFANTDRKSPNKESFITRGFGKDMNNYILSEMEALEREQTAVDQQAAVLEKELRAVMESGQSEAEENALMASWFTLVNKKNALLRRQMQLNILKQESELEQRHAAVDGELRELLGVEEWRKSEGQRGKEATLLLELLTVVNARDQLVHHMHEHEQAIEDDDEIERNLSNVELQRKNNCSIQ